MKTVICIEGADGSGKSTLAKLLIGECESRGLRCHVIGRKTEDSSPVIARITTLSQELDRDAPPEAGFHLRIAREYLRAEACRQSNANVVILDRFILSVLSRLRTDGSDADPYMGHLKEIAVRAELAATIFCDCPFEIAWERVNEDVQLGRRQNLSPKEAKGKEYLRLLHKSMRKDFEQLAWIGVKHSIPTHLGTTKSVNHCSVLVKTLF